MSRKKSIAISIATALYTAGLSAATAGVGPTEKAPMPDFLKEVKITEKMQQNSNARKVRGNRLEHGKATNNSISQINTHRAIAQKVDFAWESDVTGENTYIVEFTDQAVALYDGGVKGFKSTNNRTRSRNNAPLAIASPGSFKLNTNDPDVINYRKHLISQQENHLQTIKSAVGGNVKIKRTFQYALSGATIQLTQDQALAVSKLAGIRAVKRSKTYQLHTDVGPKHIGADQIWTPNTLDLANKGEGVVVGIIDTGINSDHASFADIAGDGYDHTNPLGEGVYVGDCEKEEFANLCNDKLIGVRSYSMITDSYLDPVFQNKGAWETVEAKRPQNGEDYHGHGSHTASTTAGNELLDTPYMMREFAEQSDGVETNLTFPHMSGVAPRANIIAYQVCFSGDGTYGSEWQPSSQYQGCPGEALVAAIEDAITDGVDVINFSIGGSESSPWEDSIEMAFLAAREAGISAALSAGNSGTSSVDHVAPWTTSVAATTHTRTIEFSEKTLDGLTGGDPAMMPGSWAMPFIGSGYTEGMTGNLVLATKYPDSDTNWDGMIDENDNLSDGMCNVPFPADTFTADQIVVCKRGGIARVTKAVNAQAGGAGGFILYNTEYLQDPPYGFTGPNDAYVIPGILLNSNVQYSLIPWLESGTGHMATINASSISTGTGIADQVAAFSSRGPSRTTPNSMVPNVGAPGVGIYAASADDKPFTTAPMTGDFEEMQGTSMASPHVAGAMALLTQLHPDWTPAEIQSALMSTATNNGTSGSGWSSFAAGLDDYGTGVINVEAASRVGLVLDETGDNYRAANPNNGGNITSLNDSYLYNTSCEFNCSWIRTFRATQDGTFNITMNEHIEEGMTLLKLEASPSSFTLQAGEVQSVMFTAAAKDISNFLNSTADFPFEADVIITPTDTAMPEQRLPMRVQFKSDGLPNDYSVEMHRTMGNVLTPKLYTKEVGDVRVNGLVKGQSQVHNLVPFLSGIATPELLAIDIESGAIAQINFTIPEGTKRFVFELSHETDRQTYHDSAIDVGFDANGDGIANWNDEAICFSFSYTRDYCAIDNPTPGEYWALVGNYTIYDHSNPNGHDLPLEMTTNLAIISEDDNAALTAEIVGDANGIDGYNMNLTWNAADAMEGDVYFAAVEFGRDAANAGDVGTMGMRFEHVGTDVMMSASQDTARTGDVINFQVDAKENSMSDDRDFTLTATIPEGLNLSHDSVVVKGIYGAMTTVEGNTITISGSQPTSALTPREYVWTTSENDPLCRIPYEDNDFKENFWDLGAFQHPTIIAGGAWDMFWVEPWQLGFDSITHYGKEWSGPVGLNPAGFFSLDPMGYMNWSHAAMEWVTFPDTMIAALWHSQARIDEPGKFNWETGVADGVFVATTTNDELIIQWNSMKVDDPWAGISGQYNVQTIFKTKPDYDEGAYEVLFGYDRLDESLEGQGAIGTRGFHGFRNVWGANEGFLADTFAINNVLDKTSVGTLVCGDYRGPEQSAIRLNFSAVVNNIAPGSSHEVVVTSDYAHAEQVSVSTSVAVNGNISMGQFNDMTINEDEMVSGLEVVFSANNSTDKVITVSGDNVSGTASGNTSGSTVDIMPMANWSGVTEVIITVADAANAGDATTSSFMLTVVSDGLVAGCTDSTANNFNAAAGEDDGTCTFPPAPYVKPEQPKSSGGSTSWLLLLTLPLFFRKKVK